MTDLGIFRQMGRTTVRALVLVCLFVFGATVAQAEPLPTSQPADPHLKVFADNPFPSATQCAQCHQRIFGEWASSNHAYASISPMFHKFEQAINTLSSGTIGSFCVRCHQQVGTQMGEPREQPLWERSAVAREGITCVTCHRVSREWTHVNGERRIDPGRIYDPVYNTGSGAELPNVVANPQEYDVATNPRADGTPIHSAAIRFEQIGKSEFCVSCHQVAVHPGINLEVVWAQYRNSPSAKEGVTCQDCHTGKVPGVAAGYETAPIAVVNGKVIGRDDQKHTNHAFYGPGYPIAHPGLFPFNPRALEWGIQDWLTFDYRAGWGRPEWEEALARGEASATFPAIWNDRAVREKARHVIDQNERALEEKKRLRVAVMENGGALEGPFFDGSPKAGESFSFSYKVVNKNPGHNMPSGSLGAQPEIWLNVALIDPDGKTVFESGYVDSIGDMANHHSLDVAEGKIERDKQLFNLQTMFLTTNVKGTDREMYLPVNFDIDQIPHIRPAGQPTSVLGHPPFIRMEGRSIPPLSDRMAHYTVPADAMSKPGTYRLQARLRSRAEPIYFMRFVGATTDMEQAINEWMIDMHPIAAEFEVR